MFLNLSEASTVYVDYYNKYKKYVIIAVMLLQ